MKETKNDCDKVVNEIKYKKLKGRVWGYGFLFFIGSFLLIFSLRDITDIIISGKLYSDKNDLYGVLMFSSFCLLLSIENLLGYFGNKIIITESFIIIRRAALGKTYTISKRCIMAKTMVFTSAKVMDQYQILLYLKNGKKLNTGLLNCKGEEFNRIDNEFKCKRITKRKILKEELANLKGVEIDEGDFGVKTNYLFPLLTYSPLVLLIIAGYLLAF